MCSQVSSRAHLSHDRPMQNEAVPHRGCITISGGNGGGHARPASSPPVAPCGTSSMCGVVDAPKVNHVAQAVHAIQASQAIQDDQAARLTRCISLQAVTRAPGSVFRLPRRASQAAQASCSSCLGGEACANISGRARCQSARAAHNRTGSGVANAPPPPGRTGCQASCVAQVAKATCATCNPGLPTISWPPGSSRRLSGKAARPRAASIAGHAPTNQIGHPGGWGGGGGLANMLSVRELPGSLAAMVALGPHSWRSMAAMAACQTWVSRRT